MCLSLIDNLDPERTIVTVFPNTQETRMRITYSMNTPTNWLGHFLMCIPFKLPDGASVEVNAIMNVKHLFDSLIPPTTIKGIKGGDGGIVYRCLDEVCVKHIISGPFEVFFIKNTLDLDQVRNAMKECDISETRQDLMIKQMKLLNCGFVLAKYMPIENMLYEFAKNENILPEEMLYTLTRNIQKTSSTLQNISFIQLEPIKTKLNELKEKYKPHHKMINGLCIEVPYESKYECMFVLHEWSSENEAENPRMVNQKFQILCHKDYKIKEDEKLFYIQQDYTYDEDEAVVTKIPIRRQFLTKSEFSDLFQALRNLQMFSNPSDKVYEKLEYTVVLYDYYGEHPNQPIQLQLDRNFTVGHKRPRPHLLTLHAYDDDEFLPERELHDLDAVEPPQYRHSVWSAENMIRILNY